MGRTDAARETHTRIMEAARAQFEADGYDQPTIRSIARQAGVAAGTVILHFGDKRGLLAAALEDQLGGALADMAMIPVDPVLCPAVALTALVEPLYRRYFHRPALARVLVAEGLFATGDWAVRQNVQIGRLRTLAAAHAGVMMDDPRLDVFMAVYLLVLVGALRSDQPALDVALVGLKTALSTISGFGEGFA